MKKRDLTPFLLPICPPRGEAPRRRTRIILSGSRIKTFANFWNHFAKSDTQVQNPPSRKATEGHRANPEMMRPATHFSGDIEAGQWTRPRGEGVWGGIRAGFGFLFWKNRRLTFWFQQEILYFWLLYQKDSGTSFQVFPDHSWNPFPLNSCKMTPLFETIPSYSTICSETTTLGKSGWTFSPGLSQ